LPLFKLILFLTKKSVSKLLFIVQRKISKTDLGAWRALCQSTIAPLVAAEMQSFQCRGFQLAGNQALFRL
jgi:hypothetical protein